MCVCVCDCMIEGGSLNVCCLEIFMLFVFMCFRAVFVGGWY